MHPARLIPWFLFLLLLCPRLAADDDVGLLTANGDPQLLVLGGEQSMHVFRVVAPKGARALHVVAVAGYDVDLYLDAEHLDEEETEKAAHQADSRLAVEHIVVRPAEGAMFRSDETWFVHVVSPYGSSRAHRTSLTALVEGPEPVLEAGRSRRLSIPAGSPTTTARFVAPHGLATVALTAEGRRGAPSIRAAHADIQVPGVARGTHALAWIEADGRRTAGLWDVEVSRPEGVAEDEPYAVSLELAVLSHQKEGDTWDDAESVPLLGAKGSRTLHIEDGDAEQVFIDVSPATQSMRFRAFSETGDVDLYATRHVPVKMSSPSNWHYCAWKEGEEEILLVGGDEPLPVGRYWVRVRHLDGDDDKVAFEWETRDHPLRPGERLEATGSLSTAGQAVHLAANQPISWWNLSRPFGGATGLRVFDADKDVDLLLQRMDTGAVVQRGTSDRHAEGLLVSGDLILPSGVQARVGVCRWDVTHAVYAGELHLSRRGLPPIPEAYFPPYGAFGTDARARTLASAVHVDLEDSSASGVVVSPTGLILTCRHVVETVLDGGEIRIAFPVGDRGRPREVYFAEVLDTTEAHDLALLRITKDVFGGAVPPARLHPYVPLGSSRTTPVEAPLRVVAYGRSGSSNYNSNLVVLHGVLAGVEMEGDEEVWLITDARTGPGNSGGGYFNSKGQLVGIHTSGMGDKGSALGYGKPVSTIPASWRQRIRKEGGTAPKR